MRIDEGRVNRNVERYERKKNNRKKERKENHCRIKNTHAPNTLTNKGNERL